MRSGIALWGYGKVHLPENAAFFAGAGLTAGSILGPDVWRHDDNIVTRFVTQLKLHDVALTVHHKLPDPDDAAAREAFPGEIAKIRAWHDTRCPLAGLTFDVPGAASAAGRAGRQRLMSDFVHVLETFRDTDVFICCEDVPLNEDQRKLLDGIDETYPNLGVLIDLGHLNMRVTKEDPSQDMADAVRRHLHAVPLTIRELHVHNNDGLRDQHQHLLAGTLPFDAAARALREIGFDGISTNEFQPGWNGFEGRDAYDAALAASRAWDDALRSAS